MINYQQKYLKYKRKYQNIKKQLGGIIPLDKDFKKYLVIFRNKHPSLSLFRELEINSLLQMNSENYEFIFINDFYAIITIPNIDFLRRSLFVDTIIEILSESDTFVDLIIPPFNGTYSFKIDKSLEKITINDLICKSKFDIKKIELKSPDRFFVLYYINSQYLFGYKIEECYGKKIVNETALNKRCFLQNTAMPPDVSLLMVNIAKVKSNHFVLDPCCGSCSVLITAEKIGATIFGSDFDWRPFHASTNSKKGCDPKAMLRDNFTFTPMLIRSDLFNFPLRDGKFDAIITDPPYGIRKSSPTENIFNELIKRSEKLLCKGGRLVFWYPTVTNNLSEIINFKCMKNNPKIKIISCEIYEKIHTNLFRFLIVIQKL
jgi:tRNA G10  N-methylase Trm11